MLIFFFFFFGVCNDWTDIHTDWKRKLENYIEVPKLVLKMSYGGRTYRCLKKVIKKRQEERKKAESLLPRKIRIILNMTNSSN